MKRLFSAPAAVLWLALLGTVGCMHSTSQPTAARAPVVRRPVAYAMAVSIQGGLQPSPSQWAAIQRTFARELAALGDILVTDLALADRIVRIDFVPSLNDPENQGQAVIVSVRDNPLRELTLVPAMAVAYSTPYPASFGYGGTFLNSFASFSNTSYYGYGNSYYDGYSYSSPTLNPRIPAPPPPTSPTDPKHRHHRDGPGDNHHHDGPPGKCPPLLAAASPTPAATGPVVYPAGDGKRTVFFDDIRHLRTEYTFARTDYGNRADRTNARTDSNNRADHTSARTESSTATADHSRSWLSRLFNPSGSSSSSSGSTSSRSDRTSSSGDHTYTRTDHGSQSSERTYSRNDSGYSRSDSSYSHSTPSQTSQSYSAPSYSAPSYSAPSPSYSAPSYSAPSYSPPSSDSSSSGSSASSSGSSSGGGGGSSGGRAGAANAN